MSPRQQTSSKEPQQDSNAGKRHHFRGRMLTLAIAIISVGLGALTTFLFLGSDASQDDIAITCNVVERIDFPVAQEDFRIDGPLLHQLTGLSSFAAAARLSDDAYAGLEEPGNQLFVALKRADVEKINSALQQLSTVCSNIDY